MTNEQLAARALVIKFQFLKPVALMFDAAKGCAIISQEEKIEALKKARMYSELASATFADIDNDIDFEHRVMQEIKEL